MHVAQSGYRAMAPEPGRQIPIEGDARSARLIADSEAPRAWAPLRPGIEIRVLQESADGSERIALLRYRPGATVPRHRHLGDEHVYVLEGAQQDEAGRYPAGSYVRNAAGSARGDPRMLQDGSKTVSVPIRSHVEASIMSAVPKKAVLRPFQAASTCSNVNRTTVLFMF